MYVNVIAGLKAVAALFVLTCFSQNIHQKSLFKSRDLKDPQLCNLS